MNKKSIYLDYAASTPLDPKVLKAMLPYLKGEFGNPSSVHSLGQKAKGAVESAREHVAKFLDCSANEIIFTSGATEANNLAIQGVLPKPGLGRRPHVVTSAIEHESVLAPIQELEKQGLIEATYISPDKEGMVSPTDVEKAVRKNTALVSIQYANSEIGTIQPIREIARALKKHGASFHTDAAQAANYLPCAVEKLGVDMLTLSSHKIYGPKGAGALYARKGISLHPLVQGGGQEQDMRSGTENVAGIVGMGKATEELLSPRRSVQDIAIRQLRDWLQKQVEKKIPGVEIAGPLSNRLFNNAHFLISGVEGKDVVLLLDQKGIAASTGSACTERSQEPSHVLLSMGYTRQQAASALRITLGKYTTKKELQKAVNALEKVVEELRGTT